MKRFKDILFVVEAGDACAPALARAVALAENNQARLTVVDVVERVVAGIGMPAGGPISAELQAALARERAERIDQLIAPYQQRIEIQRSVLTGVQFLEVTREVLRGGHDLVVKIPEPAEWLDRIFASDDMHLLRKCPCPVWLIKARKEQTYRRILAAVDVEDSYPEDEARTRHALNMEILDLACSVALADFAEIHIVHAWDAIGEGSLRGSFARMTESQVNDYVQQVRRHHEAKLNELLQQAAKKIGKEAVDYLKPRSRLVKGWARREIPRAAEDIGADLVVMGTVARTGIPGFIMGNTAETILNQIQCSVMAIKPPGFVTPVTLEE